VFRRRVRLSFLDRAIAFLWPRGGWLRAGKYWAYRALRVKGTPYSIAAGLASGAAMSMTPFIGLHFFLSAALAWVIGGNLIASAFGTVVGNPWTFPVIWLWIYYFGSLVLGSANAPVGLPDEISLTYLFDRPFKVLLPMTVGSLPTAILAWIVVFFPMRAIVTSFQKRRRQRRERRLARAVAAEKRVQ